MILVADSGSTKTDWGFIQEDTITFKTEGINPIFCTEDEIIYILEKKVSPYLPEPPEMIFFYGAGCVSDALKKKLENAFKKTWNKATVSILSDLYAAIYALSPQRSATIVILGTGMNSCLWNGQQITKQIPSLGYILGDEGSGTFIGKKLLKKMLRYDFPKQLTDKFFKDSQTSYPQIIENVYRNKFPNRYLASLCTFAYKNINNEAIKEIIEEAFSELFSQILTKYPADSPIYISGSIGFYFQEQLKQVAQLFDFKIANIIQSPIEELLKFHKSK